MIRSNRCLFRLLRSLAALFCFAVTFNGPFAALAHEEGHDHDDAARKALITSAFPRVAAQSELYEVVGILKNERLTVYLDRFATNEPVTDAKLGVAIGDRPAVDAEQTEDNTYIVPFHAMPEAQSVEVVFSISAGSGDDLLIGSIRPSQDPAPDALAASTPEANSGPSLWLASIPPPVSNPVVLGLVVFGLGILFGEFRRRGRVALAVATGAAAGLVFVLLIAVATSDDAQERAAGAAKTTPGALISDTPRRLSDETAFVAKPTQRLLEVRTAVAQPETVTPAINLIGRVIGDPNRTSVVQSIHGGRVVPLDGGLPSIGQPVRKGDVLVEIDPYLPLADRTTILEKSGEIEQLISVAEARIRRLRTLAKRGVVPKSQVIDLETELEGLRVRRETVRSTRVQREPLHAPTDGVIAAARLVPGQVVQPQDILFRIVDPGGLWVEALVYGALDPKSFAEAAAVGTSGQEMSLAYRGFSRALQHHALLVRFAVLDPPPNLSIGQPVTVVAKSGAAQTGVVIPREAVVRSTNGQAIVWLRVEPERFEPRAVRMEPVDAKRLIVAGGVAEGERVVFRGADLINQIR